MRKLFSNLLIGIALVMVLSICAQAASIEDVYITPAPEGGEGSHPPGEATSNSIFTIHFTWKESENGRLPDTGRLEIGTYEMYGNFTWYRVPETEGRGRPDSDEGRLYEFRMSAGLNLGATNNAGARNTAHPISDLRDVYYIPGLVYVPGRTEPLRIYVRARYTPPPAEGQTPTPQDIGPVSAPVIVHDSHRRTTIETFRSDDPIGTLTQRYGGVEYDRDYLYAYAQYPDSYPNPIQSFALDENFQWRVPDDAPYPDDGTTSTCWEFRIIYRNSDNLPPIPYLASYGGDIGDGRVGWHWYRDYYYNTGVVLYLKNKSWNPEADFIALPMQKVNEADNNYVDGVEYFCIVEPETWNNYVGLPIGEYEYFFGCSDDYIRTLGGAIPSWLDHELAVDDATLWPLSPIVRLPKTVVDLPLDRSSHPIDVSRQSAYTGRVNANGSGLYLCRPTLQPGVTSTYGMGSSYPSRFIATQHPLVTVGLKHPVSLLRPWECTVEPFYRVVNPRTGQIQVGGAQNQKFDFRIMYQHLHGILPEQSQGAGYEISVWINNSSQTVPNPSNPSTLYTRYTLTWEAPYPGAPLPTAAEVKEGVIYHLAQPIELAPGSHSYFFTASDGLKRVRYPVDGHGYYYNGQQAFDGPYVNNRPVLQYPNVDPPTGTAGDLFRYRVLYKDADNQRPFSAKIYIEYRDGSVIVGEMIKEDPAADDYDGAGVWYVFDTSNLAQQFQEGQRRYYFEFTDNWGAVNDPRSNIRGETVYYNSARPESWIDGPYINRNSAPQLLDGVVVDTDGANNSSTVFEYKVRYVDADNQVPAYLDVYIGQKQDNGTIQWDSGHRMDPVDPTDTVYSGDGAWYRYFSQLTGSAAGKDYYYCFVASDGYDVAEYDPVKSPSAGTVWFARAADGSQLHKGERLDNESTGSPASVFRTTYAPLVGVIPNAPTYNPYTRPKVFDTAGSDFLGSVTVDYVNGVISSDVSASQVDVQYWFGTPGPTGVGLNNPPSLSAGSVSPDPGESTDEFTYRVTYTDRDGTMGQPPYYIRVRIDGQPYDMTRASGGEPNYKNGVTYTYRTTALTPQLPHHFYFEASDGSGFAVFDSSGGRSSNVPIGAIGWIPGPFVNNKPTLSPPTTGAVFPAPGTSISTSQWVNFGIIYRDANNEWPGTLNPTVHKPPVVFIRKVVAGQPAPPIAPEPVNDFRVRSISGSTITAEMPTGADVTWTTDEWKGLPVQFTSGSATGTCYRIASNGANTVTLLTASVPGVAVGNTFSIGKIQLIRDPNDNNCADAGGTLYEYRLNSLGEGEYAVHFRSETEELIGVNGLKRTTVLRHPAAGEITGLVINSTAPTGNQAPVLSKAPASPLVSPENGLSGGLFTFKITYSDANGDPPAFHDLVIGYVRLVIDNLPAIDMTPPASPNYVTGAEFSTTVDSANPLLAPGEHSYYFVASDGWVTTRYPALGQPSLTFTINRPPGLSEAAVTPVKGNQGMSYVYSVKFTDLDGTRPPDDAVLLWLGRDDGTGTRVYTSRPMTIDTSGGVNFANGVTYKATVPGSELVIGDENANDFYITAFDGAGEEALPRMMPISGPWVHPNTPPMLSGGGVSPVDHQWADVDYTYSVIYSDEHGDRPAFVKLDIYINGTGAPITVDMEKAPGQNNFTTGVQYTYTRRVSALGPMPIGDHTYVFRANDFDMDAVNLGGNGPNVRARPTATLQVNPPATMPRMGQPSTLTGSISPAMSVPLTITFRRPDDTLKIETVTTLADGTFSLVWTPDMTGVAPGRHWAVQASFAGGGAAGYAPAYSAWVDISVTGPSRAMKGMDMISIPLDPADGFPSSVFGDGSYALAQYMPLRRDYAYYRSAGVPSTPDVPLSDISLGGGYWIKVYEGATLNVTPSGNPASLTSNQVIHLDPGWNQIGCPFTSSVNWGALRVRRGYETIDLLSAAARGWIRSYGWAFQQSTTNPYTGQYILVDHTRQGALSTIDPWRGYWIRALMDCYLIVPPPSTAAMEASRILSVGPSSDGSWEVGLSARVGDLTDAANGFGSGTTASKIESPRYLDNYVDLYFTDEKGGVYAYDTRAKAASGETWYFKVATDQTEGLVEVAWTGMETLPYGATLTLVDEATGQAVQMKPGSIYTFRAAEAEGGRLFRVTLGGK